MEDILKDYEELRKDQKYKYIILKISGGEIVKDRVEEHREGFQWKNFTDHLPPNEPRYAIVDFRRVADSGRGKGIVFIDW